MVALLHDHTVRPTAARPVRSPRRRPPSQRRPGSPGHLAVVAPAPAGVAVATWIVLAVAAVVLAIAMGGLRLVQGAPPAASWAELRGDSLAGAGALVQPGDISVTVQAGDTLWAIAQRLAPGRDPRPVVDALTRANGGSQVQAGQQVVIPASLAG